MRAALNSLFSLSSFDPLQIAGIIFLAILASKTALSLFRGIYSCGLGYLLGYGVDWNKIKGWAVVTGASDGIGREYALQLAEKGFDIVLISRTQAKLENVAKEIENKTKVKTKIVIADFSDINVYDHIRKEIQDLKVGILVNNVGMCYDSFEFFNDLPNRKQFLHNMITTNVYSALMMTEMILPRMEQQKSGIIINLSSIIGLQPFPLCTIYSATKAFLDNFSNGLNEEYRRKGIIIQSVRPSGVRTKLSETMGTNEICTEADTYVRSTLRTVGIEDTTFGHPFHKLQGFLFELESSFLNTSLFRKSLYYMGLYLKEKNRKKNS